MLLIGILGPVRSGKTLLPGISDAWEELRQTWVAHADWMHVGLRGVIP
jgi:hypothetical protein